MQKNQIFTFICIDKIGISNSLLSGCFRLRCKVKQKFWENDHRGTNFIHGHTRKNNFIQLGRFGMHGEQWYCQNFGHRRLKCVNWLRRNISFALRFFGEGGGKAIAIEPSTICLERHEGATSILRRSFLLHICLIENDAVHRFLIERDFLFALLINCKALCRSCTNRDTKHYKENMTFHFTNNFLPSMT